MSEKDLIPITVETAKEMGRKGGLVKSERKKTAAKWRTFKQMLKLGQIKSDNPKWLLERIENDRAFAADILKDIDDLEKINEYPIDKLIFLKNQIYKSFHSKTDTQVNIQTNQENELSNVQINFITYDKDKLPSVRETEKSP